MPLRTTPSVAEQEGQLIETEATGAPQKHHHHTKSVSWQHHQNFATALGENSTLGEKQFTLNLSECDNATVKDASAQFDSWGGSSSTSGGLLVPPANLQGAAENVNLVLANNGNGATDLIKVDQTNNTQKATISADGTGDLFYRVAYTQGQKWNADSSPVTAGTVQAQVAFTVIYN
uniref:fimbrial protein n=1 Tax=Citrobacter portucalensis TaxID=1639133 RepID=UPI00388F7612